MTYDDYMRSEAWRRKRMARLELDHHCCRLCDSIEDLEVHHRPGSYPCIPNESVERDLITLCRACHELITNRIRTKRYAAQPAPLLTPVTSVSHSRPIWGALIFPTIQPLAERA